MGSHVRDTGGTTTRSGEVAVEALRKTFGPVVAVDDVSLTAEPAEFLALLGPSGSGKTTILMTLAGFEHPTSGRVKLNGEDATWWPAHRRNIGMVFQRTTLFPHMSVRDNVAFPLKMRGVPARERGAQADDALATVRLAGYGDRLPNQLSGGQQQRVALARAIVYRPPILLMDEPLSALDKALREEMQLEIKRLQRALGITVVFVTHDQTEALTMADRIAVLDHGRLMQVGTPQALYESPENPFVAGFIGETAFLDGVAERSADPGCPATLRAADGSLLHGTAVSALTAGRAGQLAVRPERIRRAEDGLAAEVVETVYVGAETACLLRTGFGAQLRMRIAAGMHVPAPGDTVRVAWDPAHGRIFRGGA
jgi:putative spermidine/putrescine transport system ATP-binding protein/mannopine transport system ATP-binding protein